MATAQAHNDQAAAIAEKEGLGGTTTGAATHDHAAKQRGGWGPSGGNPLAHIATNNPDLQLAAFGGQFQPGLYRAPKSNLANPAPMGLCGFALTTFLLSLINLQTRGVTAPSLVIGAAFAYGGLVQLLAGMWEVACGNTFGATAFASYGGFWIAVGIILTPGGFEVISSLGGDSDTQFLYSFGFFLMGWFIFTFIMLMCTLRSTVAFFMLFFTLDLAFLCLGIGYLDLDAGAPRVGAIKAGGVFGLLAAFLAWYNAFAGICDSSNSFFVVPVLHFPWSEKGRERREQVDNSDARAQQSV